MNMTRQMAEMGVSEMQITLAYNLEFGMGG